MNGRIAHSQGRNQVCSQRWARLEKFPFPDFSSTNFQFDTPQTNFSHIKKLQAKKKKKKFKVLCSAQKSSSPPSFFSSSPFSLASLFPFLLFFSLSLPFSSTPLFLQNSPSNFPKVGDSPTSPTPSYNTAQLIVSEYIR